MLRRRSSWVMRATVGVVVVCLEDGKKGQAWWMGEWMLVMERTASSSSGWAGSRRVVRESVLVVRRRGGVVAGFPPFVVVVVFGEGRKIRLVRVSLWESV